MHPGLITFFLVLITALNVYWFCETGNSWNMGAAVFLGLYTLHIMMLSALAAATASMRIRAVEKFNESNGQNSESS